MARQLQSLDLTASPKTVDSNSKRLPFPFIGVQDDQNHGSFPIDSNLPVQIDPLLERENSLQDSLSPFGNMQTHNHFKSSNIQQNPFSPFGQQEANVNESFPSRHQIPFPPFVGNDRSNILTGTLHQQTNPEPNSQNPFLASLNDLTDSSQTNHTDLELDIPSEPLPSQLPGTPISPTQTREFLFGHESGNWLPFVSSPEILKRIKRKSTGHTSTTADLSSGQLTPQPCRGSNPRRYMSFVEPSEIFLGGRLPSFPHRQSADLILLPSEKRQAWRNSRTSIFNEDESEKIDSKKE